MVSDSGLQDLFEGIIDSPSHPAVDVNALDSKLDLLIGEVLVLQAKKGKHHTVKARARVHDVKIHFENICMFRNQFIDRGKIIITNVIDAAATQTSM